MHAPLHRGFVADARSAAGPYAAAWPGHAALGRTGRLEAAPPPADTASERADHLAVRPNMGTA